jgi:LmeA-like phospholipid-binding
MPEETSPTNSLNKIGIITKVLTTAIKLWLRTQVSQVSQMEVEIRASDRQILSGRIPWVSIFANNAVYQGLHITRIQLLAENIQINVGQVLKGKPLELLQVISVLGEMTVEEKDLNNSLSSELLSTALNDVLVELLPEHWPKSQPISWQKIILDNNQIILNALLTSASEPTPLEVYLGLELLNGNELQLGKIQVMQNEVALVKGNYDYTLNLGCDVHIQEFKLIPGKLLCRGRINVNP